MFGNAHTLFRPPAEAYSLILRVADGCPWNRCTFCGMYKGVKYAPYPLENILADISSISARETNRTRRVFLADGDVMNPDFDVLQQILRALNEQLPRLTRVSVYANGTSILAKTDEQLRELKALKLHTLYMGLESGDNDVLEAVKKRETAEDMIEAGQRAQAAGLRMSVMVLIGLAGRKGTLQHATATAEVLNAMQPRLLSALRVIPVANTPLFRDESFQMLTEHEAVAETREMISHLELESTVFRADHSSNIVPLEARFPKDKERLLTDLDRLLASGQLETTSPGPMPLSL